MGTKAQLEIAAPTKDTFLSMFDSATLDISLKKGIPRTKDKSGNTGQNSSQWKRLLLHPDKHRQQPERAAAKTLGTKSTKTLLKQSERGRGTVQRKASKAVGGSEEIQECTGEGDNTQPNKRYDPKKPLNTVRYSPPNRYKYLSTKRLEKLARHHSKLYLKAKVKDDLEERNQHREMDKIVKKRPRSTRKKNGRYDSRSCKRQMPTNYNIFIST